MTRLCVDPTWRRNLTRGRAVAIERYSWSGIAAAPDRFHVELVLRRLTVGGTIDRDGRQRELGLI